MKVLFDSVHSEIKIENQLIEELINSKELQRLKRIKQLGGAHFIFPSAEHSRFSHSLGAYEIARRAINQINPKLRNFDKNTILAAALLHDIGHGPFSHTLEFICPNYSHEEMTCKIILDKESDINKILSKYNKSLSKEVSKIILGKHEIPWFNELVSSQLDVDRLDYLVRDSKITGPTYGNIEIQRLLSSIKLHNNHIVYEKKSIAAIENFLMGRYHMYEIVYMHKNNIAFDYLLIFIFNRLRQLIQTKFNFKTNIKMLEPLIKCELNNSNFFYLDDYSLTTILFSLDIEDDEILAKLIGNFKSGKVVFSIELLTTEDINKFKKKCSNLKENIEWAIVSFEDSRLYKNTKKLLDNNNIKILIDKTVRDLKDISTIISLLQKNRKDEIKKTYGFYLE